MLQAYRWMQLSSSSSSSSLPLDNLPGQPMDPLGRAADAEADETATVEGESQPAGEDYQPLELADSSAAASSGQRRQLANRLNKLAKLGGRHSSKLLDSLRSALEMDPKWLEFTRFRALRLIRPTTLLNGRFTCSVSSLEGDDLRSKQLVVFGKLSFSILVRSFFSPRLHCDKPD